MQSQFGSVSLVAAAYERELQADAARVRPVRSGETGEFAASTLLNRFRRSIGVGLLRIARPLKGAHAVPVSDGGAGADREPRPASS